jgi:hypothetical protein
MKRFLCFVCCALAFTAWADNQEESVQRDFDKDRYAAGGALKIDQPVTGDLMATGGNIEVNSLVGGDGSKGHGLTSAMPAVAAVAPGHRFAPRALRCLLRSRLVS